MPEVSAKSIDAPNSGVKLIRHKNCTPELACNQDGPYKSVPFSAIPTNYLESLIIELRTPTELRLVARRELEKRKQCDKFAPPTKSQFSKKIKKYILIKKCTAMEAVVDVAKRESFEIDEAGALIDADIKRMIADEASTLNLLKKNET